MGRILCFRGNKHKKRIDSCIRRAISVFLALAIASSFNVYVLAHSGRTDESGCHQVRAAGTRHCHGSDHGDSGAVLEWLGILVAVVFIASVVSNNSYEEDSFSVVPELEGNTGKLQLTYDLSNNWDILRKVP